MIGTFLMISTSSITVQSFGKIILSTRVRMRKCGVCMFFCHAPSHGGPFARVGYSLNSYCAQGQHFETLATAVRQQMKNKNAYYLVGKLH